MTNELLEEVCKRLEGLDANLWTADNEKPTSPYVALLGRYHINPALGFFVTIKKEATIETDITGCGLCISNYYLKIRHSNSLDDITFGGPDSKLEEARIKSLFDNVDTNVKAYRKGLIESEDKTRILTKLLKELNPNLP